MADQVKEETTTVSSDNPKRIVKSTTVSSNTPNKNELTEKKAIFRFYQVIWYILAIIEIVLGFRFGLKLLGSSPFSGFSSFIYAISDPFVSPFFGVVGSSVSGNNVLEWSTLIAMAVYLVIAYLVIQLVQFVKPVSKEEVEQTVDNT